MSSNVESILKNNGLLITLIRRFVFSDCACMALIILLINTRNTNYIMLVL